MPDYPLFISIGDWLDSIKMSQYKNNFLAAGYTTLDSISTMGIEWVKPNYTECSYSIIKHTESRQGNIKGNKGINIIKLIPLLRLVRNLSVQYVYIMLASLKCLNVFKCLFFFLWCYIIKYVFVAWSFYHHDALGVSLQVAKFSLHTLWQSDLNHITITTGVIAFLHFQCVFCRLQGTSTVGLLLLSNY